MENHSGCAKTRQQIADEYGICRKTFNKLLIRKNIRLEKGLIYPKDQLNIYDALGEPGFTEKGTSFPKFSR